MRILLADDHPLFREGVKPVLKKLDKHLDLIEAVDYPSAFAAIHACHDVDLALLDLNMPGMLGLDGVWRFRTAFPQVPVVVLSAAENVQDIQHLLSMGVLGYITKSLSSERILSALRLVLSGDIYLPPTLLMTTEPEAPATTTTPLPPVELSDRQNQVLRELAKGLSNRQIAEALAITEGTVKVHMACIYRALKVHNRTSAIVVAQQMGLHKPL